MLIITGTGRSGTKTLARMFRGHHEFRVNYILDKYFSKADPHANPFDSLEKRLMVILDLHQGIDHNSFADSSNLYIHFVDAIYMINPSAKFILTVRNGKDFVRSAISRKWHEQNSFGTVPLNTDPYFHRWDAMSQFQKNAWIWDYRNRKSLEAFNLIPKEQKFIVRIEDITKSEILDALEAFSGLKIMDRSVAEKRLNPNPSFDFPAKEEWTNAQHAEFNEIAGEMMKFFNYD